MRSALLVLAALLASCSVPAGAGARYTGEGGSAGTGGSGGNGGSPAACEVPQLPILVLEKSGAAGEPGTFPAVVTDVKKLDEVAGDAPDRVVVITEVRDAGSVFRLWYRVDDPAAAAPVAVGDSVVLNFEESVSVGRRAAAVLGDLTRPSTWVLVTGGDLPLSQSVVNLEPIGPPLCETSCGFARKEAQVSIDGQTAQIAPGSSVALGGGTFWLAELAIADTPRCSDLPGEVLGYAWAGGATCGGFRGNICPDGSFCSYPPGGDCGAADGPGVCVPRPEACPANVDPVCGCDGKRYGNACNANAAGVSVGGNLCDGLFRCGDRFCRSTAEYCRRDVSDVGGIPDTYACLALPDCKQGPACECVASDPCGAVCFEDTAGNVTVTCPGG